MPVLGTFAALAARALRAPGAVAAVTRAFASSGTSTTDETTTTWASKAIGTAAANRHVVVGIFTRTGVSISSVTIGGISATSVVTVTNGNNHAALYIAAVPTGTTANIVVTYGSTSVVHAIAVWAIYGANATAHDTGSDTTDTFSPSSFDVPAGGVAIGFVSGANSPPSNNAAWTGLTEDVDVGADEAGCYGASAAFASAQTGLSVICDLTTLPQEPLAVFASWGP